MEQILYLTGLGIAAFVSTNIDDFFITTTFFMDERYSLKEIISGKYLGLIFLMGISSIGYLFKMVIPIEWIGLMGILPMMIGARHLLMILKEKRKPGKAPSDKGLKGDSFQSAESAPLDENMRDYGSLRKTGIMLVILVTFANGGDNIGVYLPLFASLSLNELVFLVMIFLIMLAVLCGAAYSLAGIPSIRNFFGKYAEPGFPYILILIGVYIFIKCGTYRLF